MKKVLKEVRDVYENLNSNQKDDLLITILIWGFISMLIIPLIFGTGKNNVMYSEITKEEISYQEMLDSLRFELEKESQSEKLLGNGKTLKVTVTVYNPVEAQCDDTPLITANNSKIDLEKLNSGELKWVAVSRDLLKEGGVSYGDRIRLTSNSDPKINGEYQVNDCLNKRYTKRVDILMPEHIKLGKWEDVEIELIEED